MPVTYEAIATTTLGSSASSYTFSSIPSTYTDLILVINGKDSRGAGATGDSAGLTFNSDTSTGSTNYSFTFMSGYGSGSGSSSRSSNNREIDIYQIGASATDFGIVTAHIMNYANSTTYKTVISHGGIASSSADANVGLWRSTSAITSITLFPGYNGSGYTFSTGSTFTLYGIKAA